MSGTYHTPHMLTHAQTHRGAQAHAPCRIEDGNGYEWKAGGGVSNGHKAFSSQPLREEEAELPKQATVWIFYLYIFSRFLFFPFCFFCFGFWGSSF
jgi:hypothetical protein